MKASKHVKKQLRGEAHPTRVSHSWFSLGWWDNQDAFEAAPRGEQNQWEGWKKSQKSSPTRGLRRLPANPSPQSMTAKWNLSPATHSKSKHKGEHEKQSETKAPHAPCCWQCWEFMIWSSAASELLVASAACVLLSKRWFWVFFLWFSLKELVKL